MGEEGRGAWEAKGLEGGHHEGARIITSPVVTEKGSDHLKNIDREGIAMCIQHVATH